MTNRLFPSLAVLLIVSAPSLGAERPPVRIAFNFYPHLTDVDSDSDFTVNTFAPLPLRFSYFSFVNFGGVFAAESPNFLITEQNVRWRIHADYPFELVVQDVIRKGHDNDTLHGGIRWRLNGTPMFARWLDAAHVDFSAHVFPLRADQRDLGGWQLSYAYTVRFPYLSDRLYFGGFFDHNLDERGPGGDRRNVVVSENQFGFRVFRNVYAVAEYRVNQYRASDSSNVGIGFEIKTTW